MHQRAEKRDVNNVATKVEHQVYNVIIIEVEN